VIVIRRGYGGRGPDSVFPLDAQLNLLPDKSSHGLREVLVEEVVDGSFDAALVHLVRAGGGRIAKRQAEEVAVGLRRAATRQQLSQRARQPVDKAADYIDSNRQRLQYDDALANGLPIATGVIEGACRHLIKDRTDITGARWGLERAEAILKLRSLKISGDLPAYLAFHFQQGHKRNYPQPPIPLAVPEAA